MAYDEQLAERVRDELAGEGNLTERRMFGGLALMIEGNMAVGVSGQGGLMLRVPPEQTAELAERPGASAMVMQGREAKGWLRVEAGAVADDEALRRWVGIGLAHVRTLPPK